MPHLKAPVVIIEPHLRLSTAHREALSCLPLSIVSSTTANLLAGTLTPAAIVLCERGQMCDLDSITLGMRQRGALCPIVVVVSRATVRGATLAMRLGASDYLSQRETPLLFAAAVQRAVGEHTLYLASLLVAKPTATKNNGAYHALAQEHAALRTLMRDKDDFISLVSHELRTPLMTINGYLELIQKYSGKLPFEKIDDFISRSLRATSELAHLSDMLMQILQFEGGADHLASEPIGLAKLVAAVVEQCDIFVNGHIITSAIGPDIIVQADQSALHQIVRNLLSNAIKYSPNGGTIHLSAACDETGAIVLSVHDQGIGMTSESVAQLFGRFSRVHDQERWPTIRGTGLGLYLCMHLTQAMGGRIWVESVPDVGSRFSIALPAALSISRSPRLATTMGA